MSEWNGFDVLKNYEKSKSNVNDEIDLNIEYYPRLSNRSGKGGTEVGEGGWGGSALSSEQVGLEKQLNTNIALSQRKSYTRST